MKGKKLQVLSGIILLVIISLLTAYIVKKNRKAGSMTVLESQAMDMNLMAAPEGSFPVAVWEVKREDLEEKVTYTGSVVPFVEQNASSRVSGWVKTLVYPGDKVYSGQVIATLSADDLSTQLREAEAKVEDNKAKLKYWNEEIKRAKKLYNGGAISLDEYQMQESQYLSAKATMAEAKEMLNTAKVYRGYTDVKALINGVVTKRLMSDGSLVSPGAVIYQIAQIDPVRLQANVAQSDLLDIKIGNTVNVHTLNNKKNIQTKVTSIFPAADTVSRTVIVEAVTANPQHEFLPGEYIVMEITKNKIKNAIAVPVKAVIEINGKPALWKVQKGKITEPVYTCVMHPEVISKIPGKCPKCGMDLVPKETMGGKRAHLVYVTTGVSDGEKIEILNGVEEGDEVIYAGYEYLKEGDSVFPAKWGTSGPEELPPPPAKEEMPGMKHKQEVKEEKPKKEEKNIKPQDEHKNHEVKTNTQIYTCPMHPEVVSDKQGDCPKCGMELIKKEGKK